MVLLLRLKIFERSVELARAHRKRPVAALPEKAAIASLKGLDPFRGWFLYPFDQLSLGKSSRQRRDNVNVIGNTAHAQGFATLVTADRRQIGMIRGRMAESSQGSRFFVLKMM
jgi:hypothetical protein